MIEPGKEYRIGGSSKYFERKYGSSNPIIEIEVKCDFRKKFTPPSFLFIGRALAEGIDINGENTYYGHINGGGEYVQGSELEEKALKKILDRVIDDRKN